MSAVELHTLYLSGNYSEVEALARQYLQQNERDPMVWNLFAAAIGSQGRFEESLALKRRIVSQFPEDSSALNNLGNALLQAKIFTEAETVLHRAITIAPKLAVAHDNLGNALLEQGQYIEAEAAFRMALESDPGFVNAHFHLSLSLYRQHRLLDAWLQCKASADLAPRDTRLLILASSVLLHLPALLRSGLGWMEERIGDTLLEGETGLRQNLGALYMRDHRPQEAEQQFRAILTYDPSNVLAWVSLGNALKEQGIAEAARSAYQKALELDPSNADAASQTCVIGNFVPITPQHRLSNARRYGDIVTRDIAPFSDWRCGDHPERLVVGFLSGDLCLHPVAYFLKGVLAALPRKRLEIIGYQTQPFTDGWTDQLRGLFDRWRNLSSMNNQEAAELIHADAPHLRVDLSGHTAYHRLPVMAYRPAPVQVSWLGYYASTGVAAVDWLLVDKISAQPDFQKECTETLWILPDTRLCFTPPENAPAVALRTGAECLTFGSFAQVTKLTDTVLAVWARILKACPEALLRIQSQSLSKAEERARLQVRLVKFGIEIKQVALVAGGSYRDYLDAYGKVDIILDTFPYTGGTTTCEALWMGVPTLTLAGNTLIARQGASLLRAAGIDDWIAFSPDEYVAKALDIAKDLPTLSALRSGLRERVRQSPLFDAPRFATNFEAALWGMWNKRAEQSIGG